MAEDSQTRGNIGEWSELLALATLLVNGGAYSANEKQEPIRDLYLKVLQVVVLSQEQNSELKYEINEDVVKISENNVIVDTVSRDTIKKQLDFFFQDLTSGAGKKTFSIPSGKKLMDLLHKKNISASSRERETDISLVIADTDTGGSTPRFGFSIKSQLGARSTLLNASAATNFVFKIVANDLSVKNKYPEFQHGKHRQNLKLLYESGYHLEFKNLANQTFFSNLTLLDMQFPDYLARVLLNSYLSGEDSFSENTYQVFARDLDKSRQPIFKLKEFLGAVAMGLRPSKPWDGDTTKFRGIIVIKHDGDVLFYYLQNRKNFEEHLFSNLTFERPSTTRHNYGRIYSQDGEDLIKLNLQLRFKSRRG